MDVLWILIMALKKTKTVLFFNFMKAKKNKKIIKTGFKSIAHPIYLRNNTSDIDTFYQLFYDKEYDIKFEQDPKVIVDCGANIGLASIYLKNRYPNAKIIAIEPESSNYELLVKNTEQYPDIHCLKAGIWNRTTNLKIKDIGLGNWGFITEEVDYEDSSTVKAISIDRIMEQYGLDKIDVLKVDIEGSEKELFEKNCELWLPKVKAVVVELHDGMKEGCSMSFFGAMLHYKFKMQMKGENVICEFY